MKDTNHELTRMVRSMRKALKAEHGLEVPHAALRAAYLRAHGEHPHAFGAKRARKSGASGPCEARPAQAPAPATHTADVCVRLHLTEDEAGCMERLALDAEGQYPLPESWTFEAARLVRQRARVPSLRRYGLPRYIEQAQAFYAGFGLDAAEVRSDIDDAGDDSGDTCVLEVLIARDELERMLLAVLQDTPGLAEALAEWVGQHYRCSFEAQPPGAQAEWLARYAQLETHERFARTCVVGALLEWVYPDEDGDWVAVTVCLDTGALRLAEGARVPEDVMHPCVRVRVRVRVHPEDEQTYEVRHVRTAQGGRTWALEPRALRELCRTLHGAA